jgi:predicted O-methyltransferase YrrM
LKASEVVDPYALSVSVAQGKFMNLQVRVLGAKKVLEVGTLGG